MFDSFFLFYEKLITSLKEKNYWYFITRILGLLFVAGCSIAFIYLLLLFFAIYWETIVTVVFSLFVIWAFAKNYIEDKQKEKQKQLELDKAEMEAQRQLQREMERERLSVNYNLLREILFKTLKNVSDALGLKMPQSETDLDSPNHFYETDNFYLYQYIVYRKASLVEPEIMVKVLQDEINNLLANRKISGLGNQTYFMYEGTTQNLIDIFRIDESLAYLTITLVIGSTAYYDFRFEQKRKRLLALDMQTQNTVKDCDFYD